MKQNKKPFILEDLPVKVQFLVLASWFNIPVGAGTYIEIRDKYPKHCKKLKL